MEKTVEFIKNNKFNFVLLVFWFIIACFSLVHHELWRDEAQVWCLVRDSGIIDILKESRVEGHPILWYLILLPFAKMGLSVIFMQIAALLVTFCAAIVFVFKSPFNKFQKIIILFSAGLIYFLPVVARNYALIPVFLFLLACLYRKRNESPYLYSVLIIFLSNTHLLMLGFSLAAAVIFSAERFKVFLNTKKFKVLLPCLLLFLNFLILLFLFKNTQSENYVVQMYSLINTGFTGIICGFAENYSVPMLKKFAILNCLIFYISICFLIFGMIKSDKKIGLIFLFSLFYFIWLFAKVWFGGVPYQKAYILLLILIFCVWIIKQEHCNRFIDIPLNVLFIISFLLSPMVVLGDISYNFSGGKQAAEYIKNNLDEEKVFVTVGYPYLYSSISAYLPDKKLYSIDLKQYVSYFNFTKSEKEKTDVFPVDAKYYIVQEDFILPSDEFRQIFSGNRENISSQKDREVFNIYERKDLTAK